jgi:uncharacterized membrane protein
MCIWVLKKWINRGFLYGPIIPIYGFGALLVSLLLTGYYNDPIVIIVYEHDYLFFFRIFLLVFLMEQIFHNRWWDYSTQKI